MYRNFNICPEIEELKKAILVDPPEEIINSNSNSKDKFSLIQKKEKDNALDFLRKFNEVQENLARERKLKEKEQEQENMKMLMEQENENRLEEENREKIEKLAKCEEEFARPTEKFNRIANLNDLEEFNNAVITTNYQRMELNLKKRKIPHKVNVKILKQIKEEPKIGNSQINSKEFNNKIRIDFKKVKTSILPKEEEELSSINTKPLKFYSNEEKICFETQNFSFLGKVKECLKRDELYFLDIEKQDLTKNEKNCFLGIYNINLYSNYDLSSVNLIKEIEIGKEYIFEFKSAPKMFRGKQLIFLEKIYPPI